MFRKDTMQGSCRSTAVGVRDTGVQGAQILSSTPLWSSVSTSGTASSVTSQPRSQVATYAILFLPGLGPRLRAHAASSEHCLRARARLAARRLRRLRFRAPDSTGSRASSRALEGRGRIVDRSPVVHRSMSHDKSSVWCGAPRTGTGTACDGKQRRMGAVRAVGLHRIRRRARGSRATTAPCAATATPTHARQTAHARVVFRVRDRSRPAGQPSGRSREFVKPRGGCMLKLLADRADRASIASEFAAVAPARAYYVRVTLYRNFSKFLVTSNLAARV